VPCSSAASVYTTTDVNVRGTEVQLAAVNERGTEVQLAAVHMPSPACHVEWVACAVQQVAPQQAAKLPARTRGVAPASEAHMLQRSCSSSGKGACTHIAYRRSSNCFLHSPSLLGSKLAPQAHDTAAVSATNRFQHDSEAHTTYERSVSAISFAMSTLSPAIARRAKLLKLPALIGPAAEAAPRHTATPLSLTGCCVLAGGLGPTMPCIHRRRTAARRGSASQNQALQATSAKRVYIQMQQYSAAVSELV
jgi:hypothetical protein